MSTSRIEHELNKVNKDLKELSDALAISSGDTTDALQLKLFQKNEELRAILATAVNQNSIPKEELIAQIEIQKSYSKGANTYLEEKIKALNTKIDAAKTKSVSPLSTIFKNCSTISTASPILVGRISNG
ncbi:hypothetical protein JCM19241_480 [Vibrio ishigakensis]|uniref:Uncharacterized protein n=1 Tax=Vibrio ishigakensis TaxID=1481914 RepID=A0A0B8QGH5_9VIBR|nr:hypothetical protein JCM19236_949 [Vibrio sp. JCM 19236]GAM76182.1 hypothetical protein JCM19241_480 [Vibrio ishigakensis]